MKKFAFILSALALMATAFSSCKKEENKGGNDEIILDAMYIYGEATCLDKVTNDGMFAKGMNENDGNAVVPGLWEKYVALEGGKTFVVAEVAGGVTTTYGSDTIAEKVSDGQSETPVLTLLEGKYKAGATFSVAESGLYHVIVYTPKNQITIMPVEWWSNGNGVPNEDRSVWNNKFTAGEFNKQTMTFTLEGNEVSKKYKFKNAEGWKYMIDEEATPKAVKVNTNFGAESMSYDGELTALVAGAADIKVIHAKKAVYKTELIWKMERGLGFYCKQTKTGDIDPQFLPDPSTFKLGLIGSMAESGWGTDIPFTYVEGTQWQYVIESYTFAAGDNFKIRTVGTWDGDFNCGYHDVIIKGDATNFEPASDGNIICSGGGTYKITIDYDGADVIVTFQK